MDEQNPAETLTDEVTLSGVPRVRAYFRRRLGLIGQLGLRFALGIVIIGFGTWAFWEIADDLAEADGLIAVDEHISDYFFQTRTPGMHLAMRWITELGAAPFAACVSLGVVALMARRRMWSRIVFFLLIFPTGTLLTIVLKAAFERARPGIDSAVHFTGYSFPSGHTLSATLLYGGLAALGGLSVSSWRWRARLMGMAMVVIFLVAFSRVYLAAHYASDVVAASAAGFAWIAFCVAAMEAWQRRDRWLLRGRGQ